MVRTERDGRVIRLTLDNPPRQFLDRELVFELDELAQTLESDRSLGGIVIAGAHPRSFITHYSAAEILDAAETTPDVPPALYAAAYRAVAAISKLPGGPSAIRRARLTGLLTALRLHRFYLRLNRMDKAVIAAINGDAAAGGCELALACDIESSPTATSPSG